MIVKVLKEFRDINNFLLAHKVGEIFQCDEERGNRLVALGYAVVAEEQPAAEPEALSLVAEQPVAKKKAKKSK